jgi:phage gp46-like protein
VDIALRFSEHGDFDLLVENRDLAGDLGPVTPITVSLFTDRLARVDDPLPEYQPGKKSDRRGWWGDLERLDGWADPIGSRLWLLSREKEMPSVVHRAQEYAKEALKWIIDKGGNAEVKATDEGRGRLKIDARVSMPGQGNEPYTDQWIAILDINQPSRVNLLGVE